MLQIRRLFLAAFLAALTISSLYARPAQEEAPAGREAGGGQQSGAATADTQGDTDVAFPVTIDHKFGETEIPSRPARVVTVGYSEQDPVLALGVKPVAVRYWFGDYDHAVWPWAQDELGSAEPTVLRMAYGELDFERIAAQEPDLIVAVHSGITEEEYATLSQIAPTLAQPGTYPNFGVPWQEQTRLIGRALGHEERANEVVSDVEAQIAAAAKDNPQFDGASIAMASPAEGEGQFWTFSPNTPPMRFLQALGFEVPQEIAEIIGERDAAQISSEQIQLLDVDVLIFQVGSEEIRESIERNALYRQLDVAEEGRAVYFVGRDDPIYGALSFSTVLSLPYAVDELVPMLAAAVDGDPETEVAQ